MRKLDESKVQWMAEKHKGTYNQVIEHAALEAQAGGYWPKSTRVHTTEIADAYLLTSCLDFR